MKKRRSISYYARREKLRNILGTMRQRKAKGDAQKPANENGPVPVEQVSLADSDTGRGE